jgi:hypothetical protein
MSIAENFNAVKEAMAAVKDHPMCAKFEDVGGKFRVIYPYGMFPDGVQASFSIGKRVALDRILNVMERHWIANYIK